MSTPLQLKTAETSNIYGDVWQTTPTSGKIYLCLDEARKAFAGSIERGIALIYGASGTGKTRTALYYEQAGNYNQPLGTRGVLYVRCERCVGGISGIFQAIWESTKINYQYTTGRGKRNVIDRIAQVMSLGGIIIFDEAHLLSPKHMDSLRIFPDVYGIAIAFLGNKMAFNRLEDAKIAQILSRAQGSTLIIESPEKGDVDVMLEASGVDPGKLRPYSYLIGCADGGLRKLGKVVEKAKFLAKAQNMPAVELDVFIMAMELEGLNREIVTAKTARAA